MDFWNNYLEWSAPWLFDWILLFFSRTSLWGSAFTNGSKYCFKNNYFWLIRSKYCFNGWNLRNSLKVSHILYFTMSSVEPLHKKDSSRWKKPDFGVPVCCPMARQCDLTLGSNIAWFHLMFVDTCLLIVFTSDRNLLAELRNSGKETALFSRLI